MLDLIGLLGPTPAYAQAAAGGGGGGAFMTSFAPFILIFVLFYFLLIRPQQKRQKTHRQMLEAVAKGDKIVTNGGLLGTVSSVTKDVLTMQISDGVRIKVLRTELLGMQKVLLESAGDSSDKESAKEKPKEKPKEKAKAKK